MLHSIVTIALLASIAVAYNPAFPFGPEATVWHSNAVNKADFEKNSELEFLAPHLKGASPMKDGARKCNLVARSKELPHRRCVDAAMLRWTVEGDQLKAASLDFAYGIPEGIDNTFGLPSVWLEIHNAVAEDGVTSLVGSPSSKPLGRARSSTGVNHPSFNDLSWPETFKKTTALPASFWIKLIFDPQVISSYVYEFNPRIDPEVYKSGVSYDLTPRNNTMHVHFMFKLLKEKLSVWMHRKSPVAPFFMSVIHHREDADLTEDLDLAHLLVEPKLYDSNSFGLDMELDESLYASLENGIVELVAHFFEPERAVTATVTVPNLRKELRQLMAKSDKVASATFETTSSNPAVKPVAIRLSYHKETKFVGMHVLQSEPLENIEISVEQVYGQANGDKTDSGRKLLLREADAIVPFYSRTSPVQYGWFDALPSDEKSMQDAEQNNKDVFDGPVAFTVRYDPASHQHDAQHETIPAKVPTMKSRMIKKWARLSGAFLERIDLDPVIGGTDASQVVGQAAPLSLVALRKGEKLASISYNSMLSFSRLENTTWTSLIKAHGNEHAEHVKAAHLHESADNFLIFSAVILGHLLDESTNYRVQFDTFLTNTVRLPVMYNDEELALFDFEPTISHEAKRMKELWNVEFDVLSKLSNDGILPTVFSRDDFNKVRTQLESRLLNISGELTLVPVIDLFPHEDNPSVVLKFDDEEHEIAVVAHRDISGVSGDILSRRITMDLGANEKTGVEFLLQHGALPAGARPALHLLVNDGEFVAHLMESEESREEVIGTLNEDVSASGNADRKKKSSFCKVIEERYQLVNKVQAPTKSKNISPEVASLAARLKEQHAKIVDVHHKYCKNEGF